MPHKTPRTLTYLGETLTIPAWSRRLGIPESTIRSRLDHLGLTDEEALSRPVDPRFRPVPKASRVIVRPAPVLQQDDRGRGVVRWWQSGRQRKKVFGQAGKPETITAYARWCAEWYSCQGQPAPEEGETLSVAGLVLRCLDWAAETFRKRNKITSEVYGYRSALGSLNDLYGETEAAAFGPTQFRALIGQWVKQGLSLTTVNNYRSKIVCCYQFAVGRDLVPASVLGAIEQVEPLVRGRTKAASPEHVEAAPDADIDRLIPHLHEEPDRQAVLADLIRLQRVTGMRPSEVLSLRIDDLDCARTPWVYKPSDGGKTLHHGKERRVWIGPKGRAILLPRISASRPGQLLFRLQHRRADREIGVSIAFYRDCLAAACQVAGVPTIRPNQIRHSKATEIHRAYEDDTAVSAILGNSPEVARQVYVDGPADAVGRRIAEELG